MHISTTSGTLPAWEAATPPHVGRRRDAPTVMLGHGTAGNDATCEEPARFRDAIAAWARHALAAASIEATFATVHRILAARRQRRRAWAIYDTLQQLDDHTLRDIGFHRHEISSVAVRMSAQAAR
jgi:uncharacterized protein YjiS (DUF1127 family)